MLQLRQLVLGSGLAALALGCLAPAEPPSPSCYESVQALSAGTVDDGDPAVVAVVAAGDAEGLRCTGTVISERVVLTAAHCGVQHDVSSFAVYFGAELGAGGSLIGLLDALAHPAYDDTAGHDLALLLLAEPAPAAAVPLAAEPIVAAPPPVPVRLVGYGVTAAEAGDDDRKREGAAQTTAVTPDYVTLGAGPALPCNGDSGGPVLVTAGSDEQLAGVISRGDAACSEYSKATRVDAHLGSFIQPYLAGTAAGAAGDGEPCFYDEQCTGGLCPEALDEPLLHFCSRACSSGADCPAPLACEAGLCRYPLPSPGATGAPCGEHRDCLRGECLDEGWCSLRCVVGRGDCPDGYECAHLGGIDFFCLPAPPPSAAGDDGGCTTGRSARPRPGLGGLLLAAALLLARIRRRHYR